MDIINNFKCGYVAIIGEPNVGKSTLINALLKQKISIVTKKPQTTRQRVVGILNLDNAQIILLDTPGIIKPKYLLQEEMVKSSKNAIAEADVILVVISVEKNDIAKEVIDKCKSQKRNHILVLNKIDLINDEQINSLTSKYKQYDCFKEIVPISTEKNKNVEKLISAIIEYLPLQQPFYPNDIISEQPERFFVSEFIRENIINYYHDEIPYSTAVDIVEFKEKTEGKIFIRADIVVERESQKGIIIGKNGEALKNIGIKARQQIEEFLEQQVYIELRVKVREKWRDNKSLIKHFGYSSKK